MYQGLRYGLGRLNKIGEKIKWAVPGTLFQTFNNFKSLIIVTSTSKAILTTIFILNLIISKDFLKNYKSNGEKIKSSEKIWSKQLLATNMKMEENRKESTSHVVKVKDCMICQFGIRIHKGSLRRPDKI